MSRIVITLTDEGEKQINVHSSPEEAMLPDSRAGDMTRTFFRILRETSDVGDFTLEYRVVPKGKRGWLARVLGRAG